MSEFYNEIYACGCICLREWTYCEAVLNGEDCTDWEEQTSRMLSENCSSCQAVIDAAADD